MDHGRLQALVRELRSAGLSPEAVPIVLRRWADGRGDSYNAGWRAWAEYCAGRRISPTHPPRGAVDVADWLSSIVAGGGKFSHFDNFRSAVCVFLDLISGSSSHLAETPLVKSVSRAAATDLHKSAKNVDCFDLNHLWDLFRSWGPTADLPLEQLLAKTITLLMIDSAARSSDLARWQGWSARSCCLLPVGCSWADADEATLRFLLSKEVLLSLRLGGRRSRYSDGVRVQRIRPRFVKNGAELDTFTCLDVYSRHVREHLPPEGPEGHRAFFLSTRADRHGRYSFLSKDRIAAIAKKTIARSYIAVVVLAMIIQRGHVMAATYTCSPAGTCSPTS